MNIDVFIEELRARFLPKGKLSVASTVNMVGQPMPRFDMIQFVDAEPKNTNTYIRNLQNQNPEVVVEVEDELSMRYTLGTSLVNVNAKAANYYASKPDAVAEIQQNAALIDDAYQVSVAYDQATVLFNQFSSTGMNNAPLLQQSYDAVKNKTLLTIKTNQLLNAIKATAKSSNIQLK